MLRKIFPFDSESSLFNSFSIIFLSEGFLSSESALFTAQCLEFSKRLLKVSPFNLTRINSNWLSIYTSFAESSTSGTVLDSTPGADRTAFESSINSSTGLLSFNASRVNEHLGNEVFRDGEEVLQLSDYLGTGYPNAGYTGTLVVILLPSLAGYPSGAEFESLPAEEDFYFVATTLDGEWHQVIIRGMCKLLGLADEFELAGDDYLEPNNDAIGQIAWYPNIQYFESAPTTITSQSKWYHLFSVVRRGLPADTHPKTGDTSVIDNTLTSSLVSYDRPAFYEGGGNYRTKVYRSTEDCLMRRKIGDPTLPLREKPVALSPVSVDYLRGLIL